MMDNEICTSASDSVRSTVWKEETDIALDPAVFGPREKRILDFLQPTVQSSGRHHYFAKELLCLLAECLQKYHHIRTNLTELPQSVTVFASPHALLAGLTVLLDAFCRSELPMTAVEACVCRSTLELYCRLTIPAEVSSVETAEELAGVLQQPAGILAMALQALVHSGATVTATRFDKTSLEFCISWLRAGYMVQASNLAWRPKEICEKLLQLLSV